MGIITEIILPLGLAFIMFSLGLGLTTADFSRIVKAPKDFLVGAILQIIMLPLVAFALIKLWHMPPELALGIMIIAAAPGGVTSNILTAFARGDVALSIALTAVVSLLSVVTIPLIVMFAHEALIGGQLGKVSVLEMALSLFLIVTVPVVIGMLTRKFSENFTSRFHKRAQTIAGIFFLFILAGAIFKERSNVIAYFAQAGLVTLTLNLIMMFIAYLIAMVFSSGLKQRIAISIECGLQNGTLAIGISALLFGGGLTIIPAATYSLIMFVTSLLFVGYFRSIHH